MYLLTERSPYWWVFLLVIVALRLLLALVGKED